MINKNQASAKETLLQATITEQQMQPTSVVYKIVGETHTCGEQSYVSYGIAAYFDAASNDAKNAVAYVQDVTPNRTEAEDLVQRCNAFGLSPVHLADVIEDFLNN